MGFFWLLIRHLSPLCIERIDKRGWKKTIVVSNYKLFSAPTGKFADTSHRIFNEQLVLKKRLHYNNNRFKRRCSKEEYLPLQSSVSILLFLRCKWRKQVLFSCYISMLLNLLTLQ